MPKIVTTISLTVRNLKRAELRNVELLTLRRIFGIRETCLSGMRSFDVSAAS